MGTAHLEYLLSCAAEVGLKPDQFKPILDDSLKELVSEQVKVNFGNTIRCRFWSPTNYMPDLVATGHRFKDSEGWKRLVYICPDPDESVWFICEDWGKEGILIFAGSPSTIEQVLGNSHGFEYFLVSSQYDWLIGEEDHGVLFAVGELVASKLLSLIA